MIRVVEEYVNYLANAYRENNGEEKWEKFISVKEGITEEDAENLKKEYPLIPDSLIELLKFADGTYFRDYNGTEINLYFLGSELEEYPYYLLSGKQILETKNEANEYYSEYVDREYDEYGVEIDDKIIDDSDKLNWLHFSDCMNNGGSSQLFIDFSPSKTGKIGQVVMFVHDPDEIRVIADSFDEYLEKMNFDFINEEWM